MSQGSVDQVGEHGFDDRVAGGGRYRPRWWVVRSRSRMGEYRQTGKSALGQRASLTLRTTARAVAIAEATMRPAPLPEPVLPARSRIPAITARCARC